MSEKAKNRKRAESVKRFVDQFADSTNMTDPSERDCVISDLITNLLHLANQEGHVVKRVLWRAENNYRTEIALWCDKDSISKTISTED